MASARLRPVVYPPVDAWLAAPTGGDTCAVRRLCGDLGAPLEEALSAEAAGLGQGRLTAHSRGVDTKILPKVEGDDPFCGLTRAMMFNIVRWSRARDHGVHEGEASYRVSSGVRSADTEIPNASAMRRRLSTETLRWPCSIWPMYVGFRPVLAARAGWESPACCR